MSQVKSTQQQSQYQSLMERFDANGDGTLDQTDASILYTHNKLARWSGRPDLTNEQRLQDLKALLARDPDGRITQQDMVRCGCKPRGSSAYTPKATSSTSSKTSTSTLQSKLQEMKAAQAKDLQNKDKPWTSDDLARALVMNHPRLMQGASFQDKVFLMMLLRDAGAGQWAHVGPTDQEAILRLLAATPANERQALVKAAGGQALYAGLLKGENAKRFASLMQEATHSTHNHQTTNQSAQNSSCSSQPASTSNTQQASHNHCSSQPNSTSGKSQTSNTSCSSQSNSTSGTSQQSNSTSGTSQGNQSNATSSTSCTSQANPSTRIADGLGQSDSYKAALGDLRKASGEVERLWEQYRNTDDKDKKKELMMEIQRAQQWEQQVFQLVSSLLKSQHQIIMGIIRNMP